MKSFFSGLLKFFGYSVAIILLIYLLVSLVTSAITSFFGDDWFPWKTDNVIQDSLEDNLVGNTNGGLTVNEINDFINLAKDKPQYEDVIKDLIVLETDMHVVLFRKINTTNYANLAFVKTNKGLVWDGAWGVKTTGIKVKWLNGKRDFKNVKTELDFSLIDYEIETKGFFEKLGGFLLYGANATTPNENIVTFSDFNTFFAPGFNNVNAVAGMFTNDDAKKQLYNYINDYLAKNVVYPYFQNLTDLLSDITVESINGIENIDNKTFLATKLNTIATFVWENAKSTDKTDKQSVIDVSNYYAGFVPESLQVNFPISEEDKVNFPKHTYYPLYETKIIFNTLYKYSEVNINRDKNTIDKNKDVIRHKDKIEIRPEMPEYSLLTVKFNQTNSTPVTNVDLVAMPVKFILDDSILIYKNFRDLHAGKTVAVKKNVDFDFQLVTDSLLIFKSYSGSLKVTNTFAEKTIDYEFHNFKVPVNVKLHPISNLDTSNINLVETPVTIVFVNKVTNDVNSIRFNTNAYLNAGVNELLDVADYTYTITSSKLKFNQMTGDISITDKTREVLFTFWFEDNRVVSIGINSGSDIGGWGSRNTVGHRPILNISYKNAENKLFSYGFSVNEINVKIFDSNQDFLGTVKVIKNGAFDSFGFHIIENSPLIEAGNSYRFQFIVSFENNESILSSPVSDLVPIVIPTEENSFRVYSIALSATKS